MLSAFGRRRGVEPTTGLIKMCSEQEMINGLVIGDETGIHHYDPGSKKESRCSGFIRVYVHQRTRRKHQQVKL